MAQMFRPNAMVEADGIRPPQLDIFISNSKQQIDDFVGELTFENGLVKTICEKQLCTGRRRCGSWGSRRAKPHPQARGMMCRTIRTTPSTFFNTMH